MRCLTWSHLRDKTQETEARTSFHPIYSWFLFCTWSCNKTSRSKHNMKRNSMERRTERERERKRERQVETILQRLQIKAKAVWWRLKGKQVQVNNRLDNKKAIALLLPLRFPDTQTGGKHFKKALNKGLHDVSVHIKLKFHFFKDISLQQTWPAGSSLSTEGLHNQLLNTIDFYM